MRRRDFLGASLVTVGAASLAREAVAGDKFGRDRDFGSATPLPYPEPAVEIIDRAFARYRIGNASLERVAAGMRWTEGPVYFADWGCLLFSDIPNDRLMRWTSENGVVSSFRGPAGYSNGNVRDREGRLLTCEHGGRRVTRTEHDGRISVLADRFAGKRLSAPNDLVVASDGGIWFTDPGYGIMSNYEGTKTEPELPPAIYRIDPNSGQLTVVSRDLERPNGLCFSPDEKRLYVADTGNRGGTAGPPHIRVFDVAGSKLTNNRLFADVRPGVIDGLKADTDGNVWAASGWGGLDTNGVRVFAPNGDSIGFIHLPEVCANLCFGGPKRNRLFMCASTSVYALHVEAEGCVR